MTPLDPSLMPEPVKNGYMDCEDCDGRGVEGEPRYMGEFQPPECDPCLSCNGSGRWKVDLFTGDQMHAFYQLAMERAAQVCDEMCDHYSALKDTALLNGDVDLSNASSGEPRACEFLAAAIRALALQEKTNG